MIGWTDRNYRYLIRQITRQTLLYTEMVMDKAIVYNTTNEQLADYIGFNNEVEPPLVLQLGGNDPERLGEAVSIAERYGQFAEINLNNGCPSNKAKKAGFGAELMLEPELVRQILHTMQRRASHTEITVKCRIGIKGKKESWDDLVTYIEACRAAGCRKVIVHSRVCVLSGLTPAQNRTIPPLRYDVVYRLIDQYPELKFVLNGGVKSMEEVDCHMRGTGLHYQYQYQQQQDQQNGSKELGKEEEEEEGNCLDLDLLSRSYSGGGGSGLAASTDSQYVPLWSASMTHRMKRSMQLTETAFSRENSSIFCDSVSAVVRGGYVYRGPEARHTNTNTNTIANTNTSHPDQPYAPSDKALCDLSHSLYAQEGGSGLAGVMIGREAYNNPWALANADRHFFNKSNPGLSRREVLQNYCDHTREAQDNDHAKNSSAVLCKPLHNFFAGCRTNKLFKQKFDDLIKQKTEKKQSKTSTKQRKVIESSNVFYYYAVL
jgi:tRNA-dihydrouridine synthase